MNNNTSQPNVSTQPGSFAKADSRAVEAQTLDAGFDFLRIRISLCFGLQTAQWFAFKNQYEAALTSFLLSPAEAAGRQYVWMDHDWKDAIMSATPPTTEEYPATHKLLLMNRRPEPKDVDVESVKNWKKCVETQQMTVDRVAHLIRVYTDIFIPHMPKANPKWPKITVRDIVYNMRMFVAHLKHIHGEQNGLVTLPVPPMDDLGLSGTSETIDRRDLALVEQHVIDWAKFIRRTLEEVSPHEAEVDHEFPTLSMEIKYWKARLKKLEDLIAQLHSTEIAQVLDVLTENASAFVQPIHLLREDVMAAYARCKDIDRHIFTLERYIEKLESGRILAVEAVLPRIVHTISLIWKNSEHYDLTRLITTLRCICNVVITCVRDHIDIDNIWVTDSTEAYKKVAFALEVVTSFKVRIFAYRTQMNADNPLRQWNFEHSKALTRLDKFISRVQELVMVLECSMHYENVKDLHFGGLRSDLQETNIRRAMEEFQRTLSLVKKASGHILDMFSATFEPMYHKFSAEILHCDRCIASSIAAVVRESHSTDHALHILDLVSVVAQRPTVRIGLETTFERLLVHVGDELEAIQRQVQNFRSKPPIFDPHLPPAAGVVQWLRGMRARVSKSLDTVRRLHRTCFVNTDCSPVMELGNRIIKGLTMLDDYEIEKWGKKLTEVALEGANATLLRRLPNRATVVNFDSQMMVTMNELRYFIGQEVPLPSTAEYLVRNLDDILLNHNKLDYTALQLNAVQETLSEYEKPLVQQRLDAIEDILRRGETEVTWQSADLGMYVGSIMKEVTRLHGVISYVKGNYEVILRLIKGWKEVHKVVYFSDKAKELKKRNILSELTAMWQADSQGMAKREIVAKRCLRRWRQNVSYQIHSPDDVAAQGRRIRRLMEATRDALNVDPTTLEWRTYVLHVQSACQRGLITSQKTTLERLAELLEHDAEQVMQNSSARYFQESSHLMELKFDLTDREPSFSPSVRRDDFGSVHMRVFEWVNMVYDISKTVLRLDSNQNFHDASVTSMTLNSLRDDIIRLMHVTLEKVDKLKMDYAQHAFLWTDSGESYSALVADQLDNIEYCESQIGRFEVLLQEITARPDIITFGWLRVDCTPMRSKSLMLANRWKGALLRTLCNAVHRRLDGFEQFVNQKLDVFTRPVANYEDLLIVMANMQELNQRSENYNEMFEPLLQVVSMLKRHDAPLPFNILQQIDAAGIAWKRLKKVVLDLQQTIYDQQVEEAQRLSDMETSYLTSFELFRKSKFLPRLPTSLSRIRVPRMAYKIIEEIHIHLRNFESRLVALHEKQILFNIPKCLCPEVQECRVQLILCKELWDVIALVMHHVDDWKSLPFQDTDVEALEHRVKRVYSDVEKVDPDAKQWDAYREICDVLHEFVVTIPIIADLRNPALREQHWEELVATAQGSFKLSADVTMAQFMDLQLHSTPETVGHIVDKAVRQQQIEVKLEAIKHHWLLAIFMFADRGAQTIVVVTDDFFSILEEHQAQIHSLISTRHSGDFLSVLQEWRGTLSQVEAMMSSLLDVQRVWLYLSNIFLENDDIAKQLPDDTKAFMEIDSQIKSILRLVIGTPKILDFCAKEGLGQWLKRLREELSLCERVLDQLLSEKRKKIPRFYFLSTSDLLDVLSNVAKTPRLISRYISKLLPGVQFARFVGSELKGLVGFGAEDVMLPKSIRCKGRIETWWKNIEDELTRIVLSTTYNSSVAHADNKAEIWVASNLGQVTLIVNQLVFCSDVLTAFNSMDEGNDASMRELRNSTDTLISDLVKLISSKQLKESETIRLRNIVTYNVHNREIVAELIAKKAQTPYDFQWQRQLRQRMDERTRRVHVDVCDASFEYGNEYLGNSLRLVITPLTDRIYVTLTQSLRLKMGGAPSGPAGTGKTETTKDLGAHLGKAVFVFNCSEQMSSRGLELLFKGIAASGCWGCFDEVNRLTIQVLSVVSTIFKGITDTLKEGRRVVVLGDDSCALDSTCGVFITMNPGYRGRTELPESFKSLFRPVTVLLPDSKLIAENVLLSEGFKTAQDLGRKIILLFDMCKDLLRKARHYDWGLRTLKTLLLHAGSKRRNAYDGDEESVFVAAVRDMMEPRITETDRGHLDTIIEDIFPKKSQPRSATVGFTAAFRKAAATNGYQADESVLNRVRHLQDLLAVRHCVFLLGPAGCGKSTIRNALAWTMRELDEKVVVRSLDPKVVTSAELYGSTTVTKEWRDGLFSTLMRDMSLSNDDGHRWIALDGDIDTNWIESMNSVMDDNRVLTLASNERIGLTPKMRLIFETTHLNNTTQATVSRAGIVYINKGDVGWLPMIQSFFEGRGVVSNVTPLIDKYFADSFAYVAKEFKCVVPFHEMQVARTICVVLDAVLENVNMEALNDKDFEAVFVSCLISVLSGLLDDHATRKRFDQWWRNEWKSVRIPTDAQVHEFIFNPEHRRFERWTERLRREPNAYISDVALTEAFVQTPHTLQLSYLTGLLVKKVHPVLIVGTSGTGKTLVIRECLDRVSEAYLQDKMSLNYCTTSAEVQNVLERNLERKIGRSYHPRQGRRLLLFLDDLNLPEVDNYGTQPPLCFLRQHIDSGVWYERPKWGVLEVEGVQYVACMNQNVGSYNVDLRLQRHFAVFCAPEANATSFQYVYGYMLRELGGAKLCTVVEPLLESIFTFHEQVTREVQRSSVKYVYGFSHRHVCSVIEGLLKGAHAIEESREAAFALVIHEVLRSYLDVCMDDSDVSRMRDIMLRVFGPDALKSSNTYVTSETRLAYGELRASDYHVSIFDRALQDYGKQVEDLNVVLHETAVLHTCRLMRILELRNRNMLVVGTTGSGKRTCIKLAAFVCGIRCVGLPASALVSHDGFREAFKVILLKCGLKNDRVLINLTETDLTLQMTVDVCSYVSTGMIPGLLGLDELDDIVRKVTNEVQAASIIVTKENCIAYFSDKARNNLRLSLTVAPGEPLRIRVRRFPTLITHMIVVWHLDWSGEAHHAVARATLTSDVTLRRCLEQRDGEAALTGMYKKLVEFVQFVHNEVRDEITQAELPNVMKLVVTPKAFSDLLQVFLSNLQAQSTAAVSRRQRYVDGVRRIEEAHRNTHSLYEVLGQTRALANEKKAAADVLLMKLATERKSLEVEDERARAEEAVALEINQNVKERTKECEENLASTMPLLERAQKALNTLNKANLTELKSFKNPPQEVVDVLACVIILFSATQQAGFVGVREKSWSTAQKLMIRVDVFLQQLKSFNKDDIPEYAVNSLKPYLTNPDFTGEAIGLKSYAAAGLCDWVRNVIEYRKVMQIVTPKRHALDQMQKRLVESNTKVIKSRAAREASEQQLYEMELQYKDVDAERKQLAEEVASLEMRLLLSERLVRALGSERDRWSTVADDIQTGYTDLVGDALISACFEVYCPPLPLSCRQNILRKWLDRIGLIGLTVSEKGRDPVHTLTTPVQTASWAQLGLTQDRVSVQNVAVMEGTNAHCIIVDPHVQVLDWIVTAHGDYTCVAHNSKELVNDLERAVVEGNSVLITGITMPLHPSIIRTILKKGVSRRSGVNFLVVSERDIPVKAGFRLLLHIKEGYQHLPEEIISATTTINFSITQEGLEDVLLSSIIRTEKSSLEDEQQRLARDANQQQRALVELEDAMVGKLSTETAASLLDASLVESLENLKVAEADTRAKGERTRKLQQDIMSAREVYRPLANRASKLYFVLQELRKLDPIYQYSLDSYQRLLKKVLIESDAEDDDSDGEARPTFESGGNQASLYPTELKSPMTRVAKLIERFSHTLFHYVSRGLLRQHKLMFSMIFAVSILQEVGDVDHRRLLFLLSGGAVAKERLSTHGPEGLPVDKWRNVLLLTDVSGFERLPLDIETAPRKWIEWTAHHTPETERLPGEWRSCSDFDKLLVVAALRRDRLVAAMQRFVIRTLGSDFSERPLSFSDLIQETESTTPVLFILTPGVDVLTDVELQSKKLGFTPGNNKMVTIAAGEGQAERIMSVLEHLATSGGWVMIQNIHLMDTWMPDVEAWMADRISKSNLHTHFRLFYTTEPTADPDRALPPVVVQRCIKVTNEPAQSFRANLARAFSTFNSDFFESSPKQSEFKALMFAMCYFHSVVVGRAKFGYQGWAKTYSFNHSDLRICSSVLFNYLDTNTSTIPWEDIRYIVGDIMYGGHITDAWDMRILNSYLQMWIEETTFTGGLIAPAFRSPAVGNYAHYLGCIDLIPEETAATFGLHPNAAIQHSFDDANSICAALCAVYTSEASATTMSHPDALSEFVEDMLSKVPEGLSPQPLRTESGPFQTLYAHEAVRMNELTSYIRETLEELFDSLRGRLVSSDALEYFALQLSQGTVPDKWHSRAFESTKTLRPWLGDLVHRHHHLDTVTFDAVSGIPKVVQIGALFSPGSVITAVLQHSARRSNTSIDALSLGVEVTKKSAEEVVHPPREGCFVYGLQLEGARWDKELNHLVDPIWMETHSSLPVTQLKALSEEAATVNRKLPHYTCPVYSSPIRGPTYVFSIQLRSAPGDSIAKWTQRGACAVLSSGSAE